MTCSFMRMFLTKSSLTVILLKNPKDTIDFDDDLDHKIKKGWKDLGADSVLHTDVNGNIHHVNFIEKILATALAKMSNFIPEGGIWMNTQKA